MNSAAEILEVSMLAGIVLFAVMSGMLLPSLWRRSAEWISDRRIRLLCKQLEQHRDQREWEAVGQRLVKVVRLLRRMRQTPDIRLSLAEALRDHADAMETLGRGDEELHLRREAYAVAAGIDGLPPEELARFALELGVTLYGRLLHAEAVGYLEQAVAGEPPGTDWAAIAAIMASVARRRTGQAARAVELARDAVRMSGSAEATLWCRAKVALAMALADMGQDGRPDALEALKALDENGSDALHAQVYYANGYVAGAPAEARRYALRAKEILQQLRQREPDGYRQLLADVDRLLERL